MLLFIFFEHFGKNWAYTQIFSISKEQAEYGFEHRGVNVCICLSLFLVSGMYLSVFGLVFVLFKRCKTCREGGLNKSEKVVSK